MALQMHRETRAFFRPRRALGSRAAHNGTRTSTKRIEIKMSFGIDNSPLAKDARGFARRNVSRARRSILFVTPFLPSPPSFGAQRRLHELISGLAADNDVSVLSLVDPREDHQQAVRATQAYCTRVVAMANPAYAAAGLRKRLLQLASLASTHSYDWLEHSDTPFAMALEQLLAKRYDVVQFELAPMASYASACEKLASRRPLMCLDEHNIEYDIVRRTAATGAGPLRCAYSAIEWRKLRRDERRVWKRFDGCTLTSVRDQLMLLADAPRVRTEVVPNGVDLEYFRPSPTSIVSGAPTLLFFGAIDYFPNTDAVLYFLREVWPSLTARHPGLRLCVVGRKPPPSILEYRSASIEVPGMVDDLRPWIDRADAIVVPLRIGGGTRLKILEAMAMGKAVVSTPVGAEGLDVVPERDFLLGEDAESFGRQVSRLLGNPALVRRLGASARRVVSEKYSWKVSVDRLSAFYERLLRARAMQARAVLG
jgi:polysaccharide biosynthesis protein PslH